MERIPRWLRRTIGTVLGLALGLVGCGFVLYEAAIYDPPPSAEAKERERMLLALQPEDLGVEELELLYEGSTAGQPTGQGPFEPGLSPRSHRRYSFEGELVPVCQVILDHLLGGGWVLEELEEGCTDVGHREAEPEFDLPARDSIYVFMIYDCGAFGVRGTLSLDVEHSPEQPREVVFELESAYPNDPGHGPETTTTVVPVHPACMPDPER